LITRSNNPESEARSTSTKSDNETSTIKKTKLSRRVNIEVIYAICQVLNDLDKECCKFKLKISSSSTSNLIIYLLSTYGIILNRSRLSGPDSDNNKNNKLTITLIKFIIYGA
ncbi:1895_t:CDS:2, partial [Dentiscutata erythropus]